MGDLVSIPSGSSFSVPADTRPHTAVRVSGASAKRDRRVESKGLVTFFGSRNHRAAVSDLRRREAEGPVASYNGGSAEPSPTLRKP